MADSILINFQGTQANNVYAMDVFLTTIFFISVSFNGVRVADVKEDGSSSPKYPHACTIVAEYDPEGMLVRLCPEG